MFLIIKQNEAYRAVPICSSDHWVLRKGSIGQQETIIVLYLNKDQYLVYSTGLLTAKYPTLEKKHLIPLCNEIISVITNNIMHHRECINISAIAGAVELKHRKLWYSAGVITPTTLEEWRGHPTDPKTEMLISRICVAQSNIILINHTPPADIAQEELPL